VGQLSDLADPFANKYVINGAKANLQRLRTKLDEEGNSAMTSTAMNTLQNAAGIAKGKFQQATYNPALVKLMPKAPELLGDPELIDNLQKLGRVSQAMQQMRRGSAPNVSGTFIAAAKEASAQTAEGAANVAAHGIPVGTWARKYLSSRSKATAVHEALKPGAGLAD